MIRMMTAAGVALLMTAGPVFAQASSEGQILCQQDLQKVRSQVEQRQSSLSPAQQQNLSDRLKVANDQCLSSPALAQTTIAEIRQDLTGQGGTPQSAQTPGAPSVPSSPTRTPD